MESKDIIIFSLGFFTALFINYTTHIFAKIRDKKNNFLRISDDLKKPFIEAKSIFNINTGGIASGYIIGDVFARFYSSQSRNIQAIMPYIPIWQRKHLQIAWDEYRKEVDSENTSSWFDNRNLFKKNEEIIEKRKRRINKLDRILFFFDYHNMFSLFKIFQRLLS
ncbi:MAG: hypothetical protein HY739_03790 [Desulfobacterales bacterium]|nr:hypothetical protein [Desulfobacterales bacterium]